MNLLRRRRPVRAVTVPDLPAVPGPVVDQPDAARLFVYVVQAAAGGRCETRWAKRPDDMPICGPGPHDGRVAHRLYDHDIAAGRYDPDRAVWVCERAHRWIFTCRADATAVGLLNPDVHG